MKKIVLFFCFIALLNSFAVGADESFIPELTDSFLANMKKCKDKDMAIVDYHIHIRGGMTPEKAAIRQEKTGIISGVLENTGRNWPLSDNDKLRAFIENAEKARANGKPLLIGIQVNDRDWFKTIDPELHKRLDYVLADTMIMDTDKDGNPAKMWLDGYTIGDPEKWMQRYMDHNRQVLSEPINILANPTYLPKPVEHLYDKLWTEERMKEIISKAIEKNIAIEVQSTSTFPNVKFLKLAKEMGAKFSFGTNNFDAKPLPTERWFKIIDELKLEKKDLWTIP